MTVPKMQTTTKSMMRVDMLNLEFKEKIKILGTKTRKTNRSNAEIAAVVDESETYLVLKNMARKIRMTSSATNGSIAKIIPAEVATAFPPLKLM